MDAFIEIFNTFKNTLMNFLPRDPFMPSIQKLEAIPWMGVLNWFIPVGELLTIFGVWVGAVATFYTFSALYRLLKVIGS